MTLADLKRQARAVQLTQLRRRAVNDVTRAVAREGIALTFEEVDDLGEQVLVWMSSRLGLRTRTTDAGVEFVPNE